MDIRDVRNLMKHSYLLGFSDGANAFRSHGNDLEVNEEEREEGIESLLEDYKQSGYMDYGDDMGSK